MKMRISKWATELSRWLTFDRKHPRQGHWPLLYRQWFCNFKRQAVEAEVSRRVSEMLHHQLLQRSHRHFPLNVSQSLCQLCFVCSQFCRITWRYQSGHNIPSSKLQLPLTQELLLLTVCQHPLRYLRKTSQWEGSLHLSLHVWACVWSGAFTPPAAFISHTQGLAPESGGCKFRRRVGARTQEGTALEAQEKRRKKCPYQRLAQPPQTNGWNLKITSLKRKNHLNQTSIHF